MCSPATWEIYKGVLGAFYSHAILTCDTLGLPNWTEFDGVNETGNFYYLIVPATASQEGLYGKHSSGADIPPTATPCLPQDPTNCN